MLYRTLLASVEDPDLDPHGSALTWLSWIRILTIRNGNADPDPGAWKLIKLTNKPSFLYRFTLYPVLPVYAPQKNLLTLSASSDNAALGKFTERLKSTIDARMPVYS